MAPTSSVSSSPTSHERTIASMDSNAQTKDTQYTNLARKRPARLHQPTQIRQLFIFDLNEKAVARRRKSFINSLTSLSLSPPSPSLSVLMFFSVWHEHRLTYNIHANQMA